jgi:hypothetical protein
MKNNNKAVLMVLVLLFAICVYTGADNGREGSLALVCKYCGREVRSSGGGKLTWQGSEICKAAQGGKHILLPVPGHCVYCGRQVRTAPGGVLIYNGSAACSVSPTKRHSLQD